MSSNILKKHLSYSDRSQQAVVVTKKRVRQLQKQNHSAIVSRRVSAEVTEHQKSYLELATDEIQEQKDLFNKKVTEYGTAKPRKSSSSRKAIKSHKKNSKHVHNILKLYKKR